VPRTIPINGAELVVVELRLVVWLIPEITLPWMLVIVVAVTLGASIPLTSFDDPVIVVVPVPFAAPKPIVLKLTVVDAAVEELRVIPA